MYTIDRVYPDNVELNKRVDQLLNMNGLRRDPYLDYTCVMRERGRDTVVATGSCFQKTLRGLAVHPDYQGEGLMSRILGHLLEIQMSRQNDHVFLYTKPKNVRLFCSLGFYEIAKVEGEIALLENRATGFFDYCDLIKRSCDISKKTAAIVMNANPFTLGHRALIEYAAEKHEEVIVFVVNEEASLIPFPVRKKLIQEGTADLRHVRLWDSGDYMVSNATFPSYFLRDSSDVNTVHAQLDVEVFKKIATTVGILSRYVGEEPTSRVTSIYNNVLMEQLPKSGIDCIVVPRKTTTDGRIISASTVRMAIHDGDWTTLREMTPESTWRYFCEPSAAPIIELIQKSDQVIHY